MMARKIISVILIIFSTNSNAENLGDILTELFADKEKLFSPVLEETIWLSNSDEGLIFEGDFYVSYSGHYAISLGLSFVNGYKERVIEGIIWPAKGERKKEVIEEMSFDAEGDLILRDASSSMLVYKSVKIDGLNIGPTTSGVGILNFFSPGDVPKKKNVRMSLRIPRSERNYLLFERYQAVTVTIKRLSSISR